MKSLTISDSRLIKQTHPITQRLIKVNRNALRLDFIFAKRRIIHVITPITGTAIKSISVPQAKIFCQPSVNKKSFNGKTPIEKMAKLNKAITKAKAKQPIIK